MRACRFQPFLVMLSVCTLLACAEKPRGGVDWSSFDYRKSEQMALPADNDASYSQPARLCSHNEICE